MINIEIFINIERKTILINGMTTSKQNNIFSVGYKNFIHQTTVCVICL